MGPVSGVRRHEMAPRAFSARDVITAIGDTAHRDRPAARVALFSVEPASGYLFAQPRDNKIRLRVH